MILQAVGPFKTPALETSSLNLFILMFRNA